MTQFPPSQTVTAAVPDPRRRARSYPDAGEVARLLQPSYPVYCLRPHVFERAARTFIEQFPGTTLYAVKCNPHPAVLRALHAGGVHAFDTASLGEIARVAETFDAAECFFMHPVKPRPAIASAHRVYGVLHYVVDHMAELHKLAFIARARSLDPENLRYMVAELQQLRSEAMTHRQEQRQQWQLHQQDDVGVEGRPHVVDQRLQQQREAQDQWEQQVQETCTTPVRTSDTECEPPDDTGRPGGALPRTRYTVDTCEHQERGERLLLEPAGRGAVEDRGRCGDGPSALSASSFMTTRLDSMSASSVPRSAVFGATELPRLFHPCVRGMSCTESAPVMPPG